MDERKSVEGTNAARDKPMVSDSSTQLEHAAWQDGARTLIGIARACRVARWRRRRPFVGTAHAPASVRPAPVRSTAQERKIYGVFQLAPHQVQYVNPGLACTPDQAKSGCWAPQADLRDEKTWSSRAGSKDSQRPRGWTQDQPGDDLHAGSIAKEEQLVESLLIKQIADRKKAVPLAFRGGLF